METILQTLPRAKRWALILAILFVINAVLCVLGALGTLVAAFSVPAVMINFITVLIMFIVMLLLSIFLFKYQSACGRTLLTSADDDLIAAVRNQKRYLTVQGVVSLLVFLIFFLGIMAAIMLPAYLAYVRHH